MAGCEDYGHDSLEGFASSGSLLTLHVAWLLRDISFIVTIPVNCWSASLSVIIPDILLGIYPLHHSYRILAGAFLGIV
jgi:hypothetical protein